MVFEAAGMTDTGRRRTNNEDSFVCEPGNGIFLVADGMGGEAHGETASRLASEHFTEAVRPFLVDTELTVPFEHSTGGHYLLDVVRHGAESANKAVYQYAQQYESHKGMGATLTAAVVHDTVLYLAHVGDSRLYRIDETGIAQLSEDHTRVQEMVRMGVLSADAARNHPKRHVITRCIGRRKNVKTDTASFDLEAGAVYLICSDGLSDMLDDDTILELLQSGCELERCAARLIGEANRRGGKDNITVVLFRTADA